MRDRLPPIFKGIALFTPAGDLIYCIDPSKQGRWHFNLCAGLQELLGLPEPPHFLIPGYTATIDRWLDPKTQEIQTLAEVYPPVQRHQALLNAVFGTGNLVWRVAPWQDSACDPMVLETYRSQFPQLWEEHDLIVHFQDNKVMSSSTDIALSPAAPETFGYVLRLFVSGDNVATEKTLQRVHQLLEEGLHYPYTLKVVDIYKHPEQAELNQVSAIPTLMRVLPEPVRRIIGDLEDTQRVLQIIIMG
jgi:circadian clock protein KaiB